MARSATTPPSEMTAVSVVPPPTSTTMLPSGSLIGSPAPMAAAMGCSMSWASAAPGPAGRLGHRPPLDLGDGRRHADQHPRAVEAAHPGPAQQQPDHALGHVEVGDGPLAERADGLDVAGRAADHLPGLVAHGQHVAGLDVEGDDGGLVEDDAPAPGVDEGVGGAEVDGQVPRHGPTSGVPGARAGASGARAVGGERLHLLLEGVDGVAERRGLAVAQPQDAGAGHAQAERDEQEDQAAHDIRRR